MKNFMKLFVATAVVTAVVGSAFAQGAGPGGQSKGQTKGQAGGPQGGQPGGRRGGLMKMDSEILEKLKLTDAQKKQVKELKEKTEAKMKELFAGAAKGGDRSKMREQFKPVIEGYQTGMKKILTPKQQEEYEKALKEARKKMSAGRPGGPGAGGPGAGAPPAGGARGKAGKGGKGGL
jgi:Spy/CpxP family protein refolding chaperone